MNVNDFSRTLKLSQYDHKQFKFDFHIHVFMECMQFFDICTIIIMMQDIMTD